MPLHIIRNDITRVRADAVVNTANPEPVYGGGTDYAIYRAAGERELLEARRRIGPIKVGEAAVTPAFALPADFIIHTVGPAWVDGRHGEPEDLASCYRKSLLLAEQLGCSSVSFPVISAGSYGFPKDLALQIALREIEDFLQSHEMLVILTVFNKDTFDISAGLVEDVQQFIDDHYVEERLEEEYELRRPGYQNMPAAGSSRRENFSAGRASNAAPRRRRRGLFSSFAKAEKPEELEEAQEREGYSEAAREPFPTMMEAPQMASSADSPYIGDLPEIMDRLGETFQERLLHLIDERGMTDTEVYKRANLDRKLFSKIRCNPAYTPTKRTALALAIALGLNLDETTDLLARAGIALSPSSRFDLIVEYCISHRIYDIYDINALLFHYDQTLLGC